MNTDDTIVALSTPIGEGGIAIVRLSGPRAFEIADGIFIRKDGRKPSGFKTYTVHYGVIAEVGSNLKVHPSTELRMSPERSRGTQSSKKNTHNAKRLSTSSGLSRAFAEGCITHNETIDEVLLTVMRAPRTYTKEDIVEINCHGGIQAAKRAMELAVRSGARIASPGEFTKRAFLNGRIDLVQAEAVLDVIRARTEGSLKAGIRQLGGLLSKSVDDIRNSLVNAASHIEASIDFPDEGIPAPQRARLGKLLKEAARRTKKLTDSYDDGVVLREGVLAIICGKPNVGKSSLMNLLLKRDRVIVSPIPGTTRDAIEEMISLNGIPIRLVDTAGIAKSAGALEKEGVRRSRRYLELADLMIFVLDGSSRIGKADLDIMKSLPDNKKLIVLNKTDLGRRMKRKRLKRLFKNDRIVEISVKNKTGINGLEKALTGMVWSGRLDQGESAMVTNARHKELLDKALGNMLSVIRSFGEGCPSEIMAIDLREAIDNLGLIVGKSVSSDILDGIFAQFCIGK